MKTVLILGGFGFLGTNAIKYAERCFSGEYNFIVFDMYAQHPHGVQFSSIKKVYAGDFSDSDLLEQIFKDNRIDIVLHSLSTTVPVNSGNTRYDVESNLIPTLVVLGLMVKYQVKNIVYLSSGGAIYGVKDSRSHAESDDVFPISSYGVVKLAIEKYIMQYAQLYGMHPLILRLSNPYGPYHYSMKQGVVNVALAKAMRGETLCIWGDGNGRKDYMYVDDYATVLYALIGRGVYNEVFNVASGDLYSVNEIVGKIRQYVPDMKTEYSDGNINDASHFALNTEKLMRFLPDFRFTTMEEGLKSTYEWTRKYVEA